MFWWSSRSSAPVLPGFLFANSTFSVCVAVGAILNFGTYGTLFVESIHLQSVRHLNSFMAGLVILPLTVVPAVTNRLIVNYSDRRHIRGRLVAGQVIAALGAGLLGFASKDSGYWEILLGFALMGVAMGFIMPAITAGVLISSPSHTSGVASGILNSARQVGGTLGVALMGSFLQRHPVQGLPISFAIVVFCFLIMSGVAMRTLRHGG